MDDEWCSGIETQRQRKDGTLIDLCLAIASLCDEHNQHIGALVIAEDIASGNKPNERCSIINSVTNSYCLPRNAKRKSWRSWNKCVRRLRANSICWM